MSRHMFFFGRPKTFGVFSLLSTAPYRPPSGLALAPPRRGRGIIRSLSFLSSRLTIGPKRD